MDTEGTDTWRHAHAGAIVTVALAPKETVIIKKTDASSLDLDRIIRLFDEEKVDFIFIEGLHSLIAKRKDIPKILVAKDAEDLTETLNGTVQPILAITGAIAKRKTEVSGIEAPIIDINTEGDLLLKLLKKICS
jgi:molybdopterin-guanine dinucleotide biosynthesis protein MobB